MMHYDVFNGDADGICALLQLRLSNPLTAKLITGVKRDIKLLAQVAKQDDVSGVTALDISMEKNLEPLHAILDKSIPVFYCDHHRHGDVPDSSCLTALIDLDAETCTSLLINRHLGGEFAKWAVVGAFGDNMFVRANALAKELDLTSEETEFLKELGTLINYNGYGASLDDLHIEPAALYQALLAYDCPLKLKDDAASPYYVLKKGYESDYANVAALSPVFDTAVAKVFELPCVAWARRISGVFGNELANLSPDTAHGVLTLNASGEDYTVSVRAPLNNRVGADEICSSFPTGGGRKAAAGVNRLPVGDKGTFIRTLTDFYSG